MLMEPLTIMEQSLMLVTYLLLKATKGNVKDSSSLIWDEIDFSLVIHGLKLLNQKLTGKKEHS